MFIDDGTVEPVHQGGDLCIPAISRDGTTLFLAQSADRTPSGGGLERDSSSSSDATFPKTCERLARVAGQRMPARIGTFVLSAG